MDVKVNSPVKKYHQLDISTSIDAASPHQLISMMFDGVHNRLNQVQGYMSHGDMAGKARALNASVDILNGLQASLDHDQGGDIAGNLESLYDYMQRRLFRASIDNDLAGVKEVTDLLDTLRTAWAAIEPSSSQS